MRKGKKECPECEGRGVTQMTFVQGGSPFPCQACDGTGEVDEGWKRKT